MQACNLMRTICCVVLFATFLTGKSFALTEGGEGNAPLPDPGWPKGAAQIFNHEGRIAYWVGPPLGGGQWHAECVGDAKVLRSVLEQFAMMDGKKRVVVHEGLGYSFWLDPNGTKRGDRTTKIDWSLTVWEPDRWQLQKGMPPGLSAIDQNQVEPVAEIAVYATTVHWSEVEVPEGLDVIDNRLVAHGFKRSDGRVIEGKIIGASNEPLRGRIRVEQIVSKEKSGYDYNTLKTIETDEAGNWAIKKVGTEWYRLIAESDGFASRVIGHVRYDRQPGWEFMGAQLAPQGSIQGQVRDRDGNPLAEVRVALRDLVSIDGNRYETVGDSFQTTDTEGKFEFTNIPHGRARLTVHRDDFFSAGLGQDISIPGESLKLLMSRAAKLMIHVEFTREPDQKKYIAELKPAGGEKVGSWGGSSNVGSDNTVEFKGIPPGKYVLSVYPNPSTEVERRRSQTIELSGGEALKIVVKIDD